MIGGIAVIGAMVFAILVALADNPIDTTPTTAAPVPDTTTTVAEPTTTDPTTTVPEPTTTTVALRPPQEVTVQVLNSGDIAGAAGRMTQRLAQEGYQIIAASDYSPPHDPSRIWYREGFAAEAADLLRFIPIATVEELPDPSLSPAADVIIVLGTDYQE
jgi:hypothetical protein